MKKSDKKIENKLRVALTKVCEEALYEVEGFQWLTHLVDYNNFPDSLSVICVFDTNKTLLTAKYNNQTDTLMKLVFTELEAAGLKIRTIKNLVKFDTEENKNAKY